MKKIQIEQDLLAKFEEYPLNSIDRFMLQTHINNLANRLSQDRVKQARSYLKSIFGEIVDQDFQVKDPTRKLKPCCPGSRLRWRRTRRPERKHCEIGENCGWVAGAYS